MNNHFVFVCPIYNASKTIERLLHSLFGQSHEDWSIILIDDVSSDDHVLDTQNSITKFCDFYDNATHKIVTHYNKVKKWEVANVLYGIEECRDDDIICRIDGDDYLTDLDALTIIDAAYQQIKCDVLWSAHRWGFTDHNISGPMSKGSDPYKHPWVSSHLKTFRKKLINDIKDENFRGEDNEYIKRCGDQAIYLPILHSAKNHFFLPRVMYHYTIKTDDPGIFQTTDAKFQKSEAEFIRARGFIK